MITPWARHVHTIWLAGRLEHSLRSSVMWGGGSWLANQMLNAKRSNVFHRMSHVHCEACVLVSAAPPQHPARRHGWPGSLGWSESAGPTQIRQATGHPARGRAMWPGMQLPGWGGQQPDLQQTMMQQPDLTPYMQQAAMQQAGMQQAGMQQAAMQQAGMQPPAMQPQAMQPQAMQPPAMQPPAMQPPAMQHPVMRSVGLDDFGTASSHAPLPPAFIPPFQCLRLASARRSISSKTRVVPRGGREQRGCARSASIAGRGRTRRPPVPEQARRCGPGFRIVGTSLGPPHPGH